jgi:hypothetical protein
MRIQLSSLKSGIPLVPLFVSRQAISNAESLYVTVLIYRLDKNVDHPTRIKSRETDRIGYKSLAPIYFRNSNAAVIVYDITQPPEVCPCFSYYSTRSQATYTPLSLLTLGFAASLPVSIASGRGRARRTAVESVPQAMFEAVDLLDPIRTLLSRIVSDSNGHSMLLPPQD